MTARELLERGGVNIFLQGFKVLSFELYSSTAAGVEVFLHSLYPFSAVLGIRGCGLGTEHTKLFFTTQKLQRPKQKVFAKII